MMILVAVILIVVILSSMTIFITYGFLQGMMKRMRMVTKIYLKDKAAYTQKGHRVSPTDDSRGWS